MTTTEAALFTLVMPPFKQGNWSSRTQEFFLAKISTATTSCANSPSTHPSATKEPDDHPDHPPNDGQPNPPLAGSAVRDVLRHHMGRGDRV